MVMQRRKRNENIQSTANHGPSVFPTPNSLPFKSPAPSGVETFQAFDSTLGTDDAIIIDGGVCSLPLLIGRVARKTKNFLTLRRSLKRRKMEDERPSNVAIRPVRRQALAERERPSYPEETFLSMQLGATVKRTSLLSLLARQLPTGNIFDNCSKCSQLTKIELENSLMSILYPTCKHFKASIDTCFLAYHIISRYCQMVSPARATSRNQLYIAAMLVAFKFNEEEDIEISSFGKFISQLPSSPTSFKRPQASEVIRMEQKMIRAIGWRLADIVTPGVLINSVLECIPSFGENMRLEIAKKAEESLGRLFLLNRMDFEKFGKLCLPRWVSIVVASAIRDLMGKLKTKWLSLCRALYVFITGDADGWHEDDIERLMCDLVEVNKENGV